MNLAPIMDMGAYSNCFIYKCLTFEKYVAYTQAVSKEIGFDSLSNHCDESRSYRKGIAAFLFVPQVLAARMGGRKPCRFTQVVPGLSTRSSRRPCLTAGSAVFVNRTAWRPIMAKTRTHCATAHSPILHPEVFDRHREVIDDLTDAAHRLMRRLDIEIRYANKSAKSELKQWRAQLAALGSHLDASDPDSDEEGSASEWIQPKRTQPSPCGFRAH